MLVDFTHVYAHEVYHFGLGRGLVLLKAFCNIAACGVLAKFICEKRGPVCIRLLAAIITSTIIRNTHITTSERWDALSFLNSWSHAVVPGSKCNVYA
jgi:hypothetical protein